MVAIPAWLRTGRPAQGPAEAIQLAERLVRLAGDSDSLAFIEAFQDRAYTDATRTAVMTGYLTVAAEVPSVATGLRGYAAKARKSQALFLSALYALETQDRSFIEDARMRDVGALTMALALVIAADPDGRDALERWKQATADGMTG